MVGSSFDKITVDGKPTALPKRKSLAKTTLFNQRLPESYMDFVLSFGYGILGKLLIVYLPMDHPDSIEVRSRELREMLDFSVREELFEYEPDGTPELVSRLIPFGISENGHTFCWDPEDTVDGEYEIYAIGSKCLSVVRVGKDFYEFVDSLFNSNVKSTLGPGYEPLPTVFNPLKPQH